MRVILTTAILAGALLASGCAPKILIQKDFIDSTKTVSYLMEQTGASGGGKSKSGLYSYSLEVCNLHADGSESSCVETPILHNVRLSRFYR